VEREVTTTGGLRSYPAAFREPGLRHLHPSGWLPENNRAENSHLPICTRERKMQGCKSEASAQRFLTTHAAIYNTFHTARHLTSRRTLNVLHQQAFEVWSQANCA
jgi:transposase-like protein